MSDIENVRLALVSSMTQGRPDANPLHVIEMAKLYEKYIYADKAKEAPADGVKERRKVWPFHTR